MARRAFLLLIGFAAPAAAAAAEPVTAEQAMENYRKKFESVGEIDCPTPSDPDEIVVCGRPGAPDPNRLPLPVERVPGERIPGEPADMSAFSCLHASCRGPMSIDLIKAVKIGRKIIDHILHPD